VLRVRDGVDASHTVLAVIPPDRSVGQLAPARASLRAAKRGAPRATLRHGAKLGAQRTAAPGLRGKRNRGTRR